MKSAGLRIAVFDNPHLLFVIIAIIVVAGLSAFFSIARQEDPRITNRNPIVLTPVPGASAERVESLVTEPLEEGLQEIPEIKDLNSTSRAGISVITITLEDSVVAGENERLFSKIRDKLADVQTDLPDDAQEPELDDERDPVAFTYIAGVTWDADTQPRMGVLTRLAEDLADDLRNVDGTEIVRLYGEVDEEVLVEIDRNAVRSLGVDTPRLSALLDDADAKTTAGTLRAPGRDIPLEVSGEFETLDRIRRVPIIDDDGRAIAQLGDVATLDRRWQEPPLEIGRVDGKRAVYVAARMQNGEQIGPWSRIVREIVDEKRVRAGGGVSIRTVFDQSGYTIDRLLELAGNLLLGVMVVGAVIFLTMGFRSSVIVGSAIPLVVAATLFGVLMTGGGLHQMSIFGMIIALGLLIDNAIVVTDETRKRVEAGSAPRNAVASTLGHLAGPLFASTLTTTLAFAPIVLLPGNAGDFVGFIGGSVILAVASSYLVSMTVIAALAGRYGRFASAGRRRHWFQHGLPGKWLSMPARSLMHRGLRMPLVMMVVAALPAVAGFAVGPHLGREFFPPVDRDMFDLKVWMPRNTSLDETARMTERIEAALHERDDVERVHWLVGGSMPRVYYNLMMNQDRASHFAQAVIDATSADAVQAMIPELQRQLDDDFPQAQVVLRSFGQGPPVEADVEFRIYGPSLDRLQELGDDFRRFMQAHPDVLHTRTNIPRGEPKLWFDANEDEARVAGFSLDQLAGELRGQLDGVIGGSIVEDLEEMPVRVRIGGDARRRVPDFANANFARTADGWTPATSLGEMTLRPELGGITRFDAVRANIVQGYTVENALPIDVTREIQQAMDDAGYSLPAGYSVALGGSLEQDQEAVQNLLIYAPVLVTIMLAALVLTFRSVVLAGVLLVVGVLSVGLALLSTWSIGFPVSFNTILGTLGLIGVAFNDSIVVIAAIRDDPDAKRGDIRAITDAVLGCSRHIISTTLTTIGGFLPLLLLIGGEFWPSIAIVLAGGVSGATLLALVFVPAAYRLLIPLLTRDEPPRHDDSVALGRTPQPSA